jgi:pyruvate formate lyase activating enzyme
MIFNIQRYSTHDGPGIRTVVFLKGCSLGCRWCQNPESRSRTADLLYDARLCLDGCDLCQQAAPEVITRKLDGLIIHREKLTDDHYARLRECCPTTALTVCGEEQPWRRLWPRYCAINHSTIAAAAELPSQAVSRL